MTLREPITPPKGDTDFIGMVNLLFVLWKPNLANDFAGRVELP